jgi:3-dehydroquinate synthase
MQQQTVSVASVNLFIGSTVNENFSAFLREHHFHKIFILVDEHTLRHCLPRLMDTVAELEGAELIELESGEINKTIAVCTQVWRVLSELGADRNSLFVNLGGGVITDLGGFVAATFKRGIAFVNIPTTLLAQIDASSGGKTGVDLDGLKNEIGVFAEPRAVYIDPTFLHTLPKRELIAGFAEAFKHALIADVDYWQLLCRTEMANAEYWEEIIRRSVEIKQTIVKADPYEKNLRRTLNFGHTVGHALETYFLERGESTLLHGEAVAAGMICELLLSVDEAGLDSKSADEYCTQLVKRFPHIAFDQMANERLIELMRHDKKNVEGEIRFTLLAACGKPVLNKACSPDRILQILTAYHVKYVLS